MGLFGELPAAVPTEGLVRVRFRLEKERDIKLRGEPLWVIAHLEPSRWVLSARVLDNAPLHFDDECAAREAAVFFVGDDPDEAVKILTFNLGEALKAWVRAEMKREGEQ